MILLYLVPELLHLLESPDALKVKLEEAVSVLENYIAQE